MTDKDHINKLYDLEESQAMELDELKAYLLPTILAALKASLVSRKDRPLEALCNICIKYPDFNLGSLAADDQSLFEFGDDPEIPTDREKVVGVGWRGVLAAIFEAQNGQGSWENNPLSGIKKQ